MNFRVDILRGILARDKLFEKSFLLIAFGLVWLQPEMEYKEVLSAYAEYVGNSSERIHAYLCGRLLEVGKDFGPERYFEEIRRYVANENRVFIKS